MRRLVVVAAFAAAVSGCGGAASPGAEASAAAVQTSAPVAQKQASKAEWDAALGRAVAFDQDMSSDDGQSSGMATFAAGASIKTDYRRDVYRKLRHFGAALPSVEALLPGPAVTCYVALLDYSTPDFFMSVKYRADEWLFMDRLGIMVGDQLVLDKELPANSTDRDTSGVGILERYDTILRGEELDGFRKAALAKGAMARVSGSKGYASIGQKAFSGNQEAYRRCFEVYDALTAALPGDVEGVL